MSNVKTITRAQALEFAIERCADNPDVVEVLHKMHTSITRKREGSKTASKARVLNESLAKRVYDAALTAGVESITTRWVVDNIADILTPQKATAVLRVACELDYFSKQTEKKQVTYLVVR